MTVDQGQYVDMMREDNISKMWFMMTAEYTLEPERKWNLKST
jgi:hypothetical protein